MLGKTSPSKWIHERVGSTIHVQNYLSDSRWRLKKVRVAQEMGIPNEPDDYEMLQQPRHCKHNHHDHNQAESLAHASWSLTFIISYISWIGLSESAIDQQVARDNEREWQDVHHQGTCGVKELLAATPGKYDGAVYPIEVNGVYDDGWK